MAARTSGTFRADQTVQLRQSRGRTVVSSRDESLRCGDCFAEQLVVGIGSGFWFDRKPRQPSVEPGGERPRSAAEQLEYGRHQDAADDDGVEEHRTSHGGAEQLDSAVVAEGEGHEHGDHDGGSSGDDPSGARHAFSYCGARVVAVLPLLVDP